MRLFISRCHQDVRSRDALLRDLLPALGLFPVRRRAIGGDGYRPL